MMEPDAYSDIGKLLRYARGERHLSLAQVSQAMHIRVRYLDALEQGRLTELPGLAYTKGYLQAYAAYLGLDKDEILRQFEEAEAALRKGFYFPEVISREKAAAPWAIWGGLGAVLVAYAAWLLLQPATVPVSLVEPFPREEIAQKAADSAPEAPDVACLAAEPVLYPPCTMTRSEGLSLLPQGKLPSVMALAQ